MTYMKNKLLKNLIILLITISMLANIDIVTFAEANVIYAPTSAPKDTDINDIGNDGIVNEETYEGAYEHSDSIDYDNVYLMVELDDNYYCCENDNTIAKKAWRKINKSSFHYYGIPTDGFDNDYIWMYFQASGRAIKSNGDKFKKVKIDGYYFAFNEYGQMLEGFFNDDGEMWNGNKDSSLIDLITSSDNFYYADPKDGVMYSGWLALSNDTDEYDKKDKLYFYFSPSSYKAVRSTGNTYKTETINGKKYAFDDKGVLLVGFEAYEYNVENGVTGSPIKYFGDDGALSEGFIKAVPSENLDSDRYEDDEELTYYLNSSGNLYKNMTKKIGSYYYGFDDTGAMITNLSVWQGGSFVATIDPEETDGKDLIIYNKYITKDGETKTLNPATQTIHYFNKTGKRVVSDITIDFSDDPYTYNASNSGGYNGYKDKKFYQNGLLLKPTEEKYGICIENRAKTNYNMMEICGANNVYVVNKNGTKVTSKTGQKDDDDNYWLVNNSGNFLNIYSLNVKYSSGKYFFKSEASSSSDTEKWIEFGKPDARGLTCVLECVPNGTRLANGAVTSYQVRPSEASCLNFILNR